MKQDQQKVSQITFVSNLDVDEFPYWHRVTETLLFENETQRSVGFSTVLTLEANSGTGRKRGQGDVEVMMDPSGRIRRSHLPLLVN